VIAREGLADVVIQQPTTSEPEAYLAACDASVLASPSEGLPVVALESLAAGKPVILSRGANAAEVIANGRTGWVTPDNSPADLAVALRHVIEAPDDALDVMRPVCQAEAAQYTSQALARRYMALYDALLTAPTAKRAQALAEATR
jgi:glycosyltransferase involved in cell wall biosynthesis